MGLLAIPLDLDAFHQVTFVPLQQPPDFARLRDICRFECCLEASVKLSVPHQFVSGEGRLAPADSVGDHFEQPFIDCVLWFKHQKEPSHVDRERINLDG